jgi:hypothetical protein
MFDHGCTRDEVAAYVYPAMGKVPRDECTYAGAIRALEEFFAEAMVQLVPPGGGITVPTPEYLRYKCECADADVFIRESAHYSEPLTKCRKCGTVPKLLTILTDRQRDALEFHSVPLNERRIVQ